MTLQNREKDYNLSPQGDGNVVHGPDQQGETITTYPRKGTETASSNAVDFLGLITTYPRKGTETFLAPLRMFLVADYNLSPQGDGNSFS